MDNHKERCNDSIERVNYIELWNFVLFFRLTDEVRDALLKLIAINKDSERNQRVKTDDFCGLFKKIQNGESKVYVDSLVSTN